MNKMQYGENKVDIDKKRLKVTYFSTMHLQ